MNAITIVTSIFVIICGKIPLKCKNVNAWPSFNKKLLEDISINLVIQINGKTRDVIKVKKRDKLNLTWDLPETWIPSKGHSMRLASFDIPFSKGVGDLSIVSLSGSSGGLLANVNRWRGQVELDPISESDILTTSSVGESKMGPYRIFKMINEKKKD